MLDMGCPVSAVLRKDRLVLKTCLHEDPRRFSNRMIKA